MSVVEYIPDKKSFRFDDKSESDVSFLYDDKLPNGSFFNQDLIPTYSVYILYKEPVFHDEYGEIFDDRIEDRLGMLIPQQSVELVNHNLIEGWQRWYVFLATSYYCKNKNEIDNDRGKGKIVYAIIEKSRFPSDLSLDYFFIGLQSYGLYKDPRRKNSLTDRLPSKVKIKRISPYLLGNRYVIKCCSSSKDEFNPLLQFLNYYQIIELLMDDAIISFFIENSLCVMDGNLSTRSERSEYTEMTRLNKVLEISKMTDFPEFQGQCKVLLNKINKKCENTFSDTLYQVRNTIVHRSRIFTLDKALLADLSDINDYFELFIYGLVSEYKKTSNPNIIDKYKTIKSLM